MNYLCIKNKILDQKNETYLIVGQGIAGTLLTYFLLKAGQNVIVIDNHHAGAASKAAAGIINPITGRHYVKSWKINELLPFAKQTYQDLENLLQIQFYNERNVIRTFANVKEENDWLLHSVEPGYQKYIADKAEVGNYKSKTNPAFGYGEVLQGAQVHLPLLIENYRNYLQKENRIVNGVFDFEQLILAKQGVRYKNITADKLIFCEGAKAMQNPYFNYLPFHGDKGEALIVRIPDSGFEKILKQQIFIVPLGKDDLYWVGATNHSRYTNDLPSEEGKSYLLKHLQNLLQVPFEIIDHLAAIRPTVRDRRPFLGLHPQFPQLGIFNGLGTKGASLAPFFARQLTALLMDEAALDKEIDIQRLAEK